MFLRGYYYYLEKPTRCYHACLHVNVPPGNSSLSLSPFPHATIFAVTLLQKMTLPVQSDIFCPLLSYSHPVHSSRCSCVSSVSLSQNLFYSILYLAKSINNNKYCIQAPIDSTQGVPRQGEVQCSRFELPYFSLSLVTSRSC